MNVQDKLITPELTGLETPSGKRAADENFPVGSWLIRADLRRHVHALYNFARAADDISDNPDLAPGDKVARLARPAGSGAPPPRPGEAPGRRPPPPPPGRRGRPPPSGGARPTAPDRPP